MENGSQSASVFSFTYRWGLAPVIGFNVNNSKTIVEIQYNTRGQESCVAIRHFLQRAVFAVENPEVPFVGIREDV